MSQPQAKPNKEILALCREAEEFWKRQDYENSINRLEKATRLEPANPSLYFNLARAYGLRYDFSAVARCIEKGLHVSQSRVEVLEQAAAICANFKHLDMASGYYERASKKKGVSIGALNSLADIYLLDDRIDQAAEIVERAARMDRKDPGILLREGMLKRKRGQINGAESQFRDLMMNSAADTLVRIRAAYSLAGILDGAGQYDEAMTALLEGKAIQRPYALPLAAPLHSLENLDKELSRTVSSTVVDRWRADGAKLQPNRRLALLAGHPRSGTTLL